MPYAHEPINRSLWSRAAALDWFGLALPERFGGAGYGLPEEVMMFRELGRAVAPGPFLATTLAARVCAFDDQPGLRSAILDGSSLVALAVPREPSDLVDGRLSAEVTVYDFEEADQVLVMLPGGAALLTATELHDIAAVMSIDTTVSVARATFSDATPTAFVATATDPIAQRALVLAAAVFVGMAEATRDLSSAYAKEREQFGRPIGVYQAVKHRCADMAVRAEASFALTCFASLVFEQQGRDAQLQADAAFVGAYDAATRNAADTVQVHGGIGFTWDHAAHRYVERTHVLVRMLGGVRSVLGDLLAQPGPDL